VRFGIKSINATIKIYRRIIFSLSIVAHLIVVETKSIVLIVVYISANVDVVVTGGYRVGPIKDGKNIILRERSHDNRIYRTHTMCGAVCGSR